MKICTTCLVEKNKDNFYTSLKRGKYKLDSRCKSCHSDKQKTFKLRNPQAYKNQCLKNMLYCRKKKGIPLDLPRLKAEPGSGCIKRGYKILNLKYSPYIRRKDGGIFEHVLVMSEHLKRKLHLTERVHHLNGDKLDNRIDNLELWDISHPPGQRVEDKISFYKEFLEKYDYKVEKRSNGNSISRT